MERRQPRNKQQAQCGVDRSRRARRLRAATSRPRLPVRRAGPDAASDPGGGAGAASQANAATRAAAQVPEKPPMRCAFGATRAGALLGRLRLHLQTERFLAVRRDDAMWEAACLVASVALGDLVAALSEDEMQASLSRQAQAAVCGGTPNGAVVGQAPCGGGAR